MTPQIDILMATYNGEKFLKEQIFSILNQSYPHFRLLICDDHSTDGTPSLLKKFAEDYPQKIQLIVSKKHLGIIQNFSFLLTHAENDYLMFSDQDDIWLKDKVEKTLKKMQELEQVHPKRALLVHTDLTVVDAELTVLSPSFWRYAKLSPSHQTSFPRLLTQNVVTGCSMMINRHLADLTVHIPSEAMMHDWWLALVGVAFGTLGVVNEPTLLYRQHLSNTLGAQRFGGWNYCKKHLHKLYKNDKKKWAQARIFASCYASQLTLLQQKALNDYLSLSSLSFLRGRYLILKNGFFKYGFFRNLVNFICKRIP